ncbi:MAG TPA: carboxypeptidase-like regulatory domain-containing protein, partial [Chitinophagaceae bacterium]|nr:carboxypeptidase-like regulatory domain-containing protein [Chitinophagaceae bacterium]
MARLCIMLSLLMFSFQLFAQNRTITGKVTDENGSPVSSASIVVKGTKIGTTTSADGTYSLSVPSNAKALLISSVNFEPSEAAIGSGNIVNVTIKSTSSVLGEVVVVG